MKFIKYKYIKYVYFILILIILVGCAQIAHEMIKNMLKTPMEKEKKNKIIIINTE